LPLSVFGPVAPSSAARFPSGPGWLPAPLAAGVGGTVPFAGASIAILAIGISAIGIASATGRSAVAVDGPAGGLAVGADALRLAGALPAGCARAFFRGVAAGASAAAPDAAFGGRVDFVMSSPSRHRCPLLPRFMIRGDASRVVDASIGWPNA
jgi:hypothetical protein